MRHKVKIEDVHYENIIAGRKRFEIRYNDRGYQLGDELEFADIYGSGRQGVWKIIYVHSGYGMAENFVVLGIEPLTESGRG